MAQITITTRPEEQDAVLQAIKELNGKVAAVSTIARMTGLLQSRVRYAIEDLIDAERIRKVPHKAFNKHYVRYSYEII